MKNVLFFILCVLPMFGMNAQTWEQRIDTLLHEEFLKTSEVGITVFDLTTGESLYRHQSEKLYRPASVEKLVTSVTALARLGSDYTLDTRLCYSGKIENDTLKGNLYLVGGFDPELMDEDLDSLVRMVAASGIRCIADTLVADISMTDSVYWGPGWSWDDSPNSFQPYLSPLMLQRGCVEVKVSPVVKDSLPAVECVPASSYYRVENKAKAHSPSAGKLAITRDWMFHNNRILISGNVTRATTKKLSIYPSQDYFVHTFVERLNREGIATGEWTFSSTPTPNDSITELFTLHRPLGEVLEEALKESDNLCAESLLFHLAARHTEGRRVSVEDGTDAVKDFMKKELGFDPADYRIADGSGVSLYNYLSPELLLEYLKYAYYHRDIFIPLYDSLPIAGIDGTLQNRMKRTTAHRNVRAKTGSVTGVSSLAGYVKAANGHQLAFVIINQNVLKLKKARDFQDKVCVILSQYK